MRIFTHKNLQYADSVEMKLARNLSNVVIGQGERHRYFLTFAGVPKNPNRLKKLLNQFENDEIGLTFKFTVYYTGLVDQRK